MPKFQSFVDCRQLQGLSVLTTLRTLDLESPLTGERHAVTLLGVPAMHQASTGSAAIRSTHGVGASRVCTGEVHTLTGLNCCAYAQVLRGSHV